MLQNCGKLFKKALKKKIKNCARYYLWGGMLSESKRIMALQVKEEVTTIFIAYLG